MRKTKGAAGDYRKVMITLTERQEVFLDRFREEVKRHGGHSMTRTEIIRAALNYLSTLKNIDLAEVKTEDELLKRIVNASK